MIGEVVDVPSLKAPGFIKAAADGKFADASAELDGDLVLTVRSSTPEYKGFQSPLPLGLFLVLTLVLEVVACHSVGAASRPNSRSLPVTNL